MKNIKRKMIAIRLRPEQLKRIKTHIKKTKPEFRDRTHLVEIAVDNLINKQKQNHIKNSRPVDTI